MPVTLTLTDAQAIGIARDLLDVSAPELAVDHSPRHILQLFAKAGDVRHYSLSAVRALAVLGAFSSDGSHRELKEVAKEIGLSESTTYRYINTWVLLGMLEQDPNTKRYRRRSKQLPNSTDASAGQ
jgi:hypothetical protein